MAALADGADPNRRVWIDVRRPVVANVVQRSSRACASVAGSVGLAWCEADPAPFFFSPARMLKGIPGAGTIAIVNYRTEMLQCKVGMLQCRPETM